MQILNKKVGKPNQNLKEKYDSSQSALTVSDELSTSYESQGPAQERTKKYRGKPVPYMESAYSMMFHTNFDETHPHILPPTEKEKER